MAAARADGELRERLAKIDPDAELAAVLTVTERFGYSFTEADLREAHAREWGLRRMRYAAEG
jgi:hypothetical protein